MYYESSEFELPCGYLDEDTKVFYDKVVVREMSGEEEDLLANKKKVQSGRVISDLIASCCTLKSSESGSPLALTAESSLNMFLGDRMFCILKIREISEGDLYNFRLECPKCETVSNFQQSLSQLKIIKMPDPRNKVHEVKFPDRTDSSGKVHVGDLIRFKTMDGHGELKMKLLMEQYPDEIFSANLAARIIDVNGKDERPIPYFKKLPKKMRTQLRHATEKVEGGVDMGLTDASCKCGHVFDEDLPIDATFFIPASVE